MFTVATTIQKQPRVDEQTNCVCTEHCSCLITAILPFARTQVNLEAVMLSEISQIHKEEEYCEISLVVWNRVKYIERKTGYQGQGGTAERLVKEYKVGDTLDEKVQRSSLQQEGKVSKIVFVFGTYAEQNLEAVTTHMKKHVNLLDYSSSCTVCKYRWSSPYKIHLSIFFFFA